MLIRGSRLKLCVFFLLILMLAGCGGEPGPVRLTGKAIGTTYSIIAYGLPEDMSEKDLGKGVSHVVAGLNSVMSLFQPDSELSRFNAHHATDWFPVSKELALVVKTAKEINQMTSGAFDITVAPLVNLWGFGPDKMPDVVPGDAAIRRAMADIGSDLLEVRLDPPALRKQNPHLTIDLAAIAKGYCVDAVSDWLDNNGVKNSLVEIGGELRTRGTKPGGAAWRIAVEKPVSNERAVQAVIQLSGKAMATSGDYRNYFEADGKRYSHIIDPTTGRPISHTLVSVSVVDSTCMRADALATGLMVLGPEKGVEMANKNDLAAFFVVKTPEGFAETSTGDFPKHEIMK